METASPFFIILASSPCITRPNINVLMNLVKRWLYMKANMLYDEKGYQARNDVSTVVGAFLVFFYFSSSLFGLYLLSHTFFIHWFTGIRGSKVEWFPAMLRVLIYRWLLFQNHYMQHPVYVQNIFFFTFCIRVSSGHICSDAFHLTSFEMN